jgi:PKD domain-containing protein
MMPVPLRVACMGAVLALAAEAAQARACSLDSKPSVSANGVLARLNTQVPITDAAVADWTPFVFARPVSVRHTVTFAESRDDVAKSLTAAAMRRPWLWDFGDRQSAHGWAVRHSYRAQGRYRITVSAYDPGTKRWYQFDQVTITVHR